MYNCDGSVLPRVDRTTASTDNLIPDRIINFVETFVNSEFKAEYDEVAIERGLCRHNYF